MARHDDDLKKFNKELSNAIEEVFKPNSLREIGDFALERIVKRTKLGKGVSQSGGSASPLKSLAASYKKARKRLKDSGDLSGDTSPGKSNLTRTGQMLDAGQVTGVSRDKVTLGFRGKRNESTLTNDAVAGYVSRDRPFFNLSKAEENAVSGEIERRLQEKLKKL